MKIGVSGLGRLWAVLCDPFGADRADLRVIWPAACANKRHATRGSCDDHREEEPPHGCSQLPRA
jgi:hypothetical protein